MTGIVEQITGGWEAIQVLKEYLKKYPFTKEFFGKDASLDLNGFSDRFGVKLYRFVPSLVYYLDNRIRFAFREAVNL
jgi:hypothetical protein